MIILLIFSPAEEFMEYAKKVNNYKGKILLELRPY